MNDKNSKKGRICVLGSRGFIGSNLAAHLEEQGAAFFALSSKDVDLVQRSSVDILKEQVASEDVLVVISALTPDKGRDIATMMKNLAMGEHLAAFLTEAGCRHVIYVGSDAVYSDNVTLVHEGSDTNPSGLHGIMHLTREKMLIEGCRTKKIPLLILRPCAVYGRGDTHNSYGPNRFLRTAREKSEILLGGEGEEQRDHLFINDLVRVIERCIQCETTGVLNVASGSALSFHDVAREVAARIKNTQIRFSPRQSPIAHRHFDTTMLAKTFPDHRTTPFEFGIAATLSGTDRP